MKKRILVAAFAVAFLATAAGLLGQEWATGKARVEGTVKDEKGEPIEGCKVSLRWGKSSHGGPDVTTDKKGKWSYYGLAGGPWNLDFQAAGYKVRSISAQFSEGTRNPAVEIQLEPLPKEQAPHQEFRVAGKTISKETAEAIDKGGAAFDAKDYAAAREAYLKAATELPDNAALLQRVAACYYGESNYEEALKYARLVTEKDPGNSSAWMMVAEIELQRGSLEAGRAALDKVPEGKIKDPEPYFNIGVLLLNKKKPAEAVPAFDKAIAVKPDYADAYYYRGLARLQEKKNAEAKADLQKYLELAPEGPDAKDVRDILKSIH